MITYISYGFEKVGIREYLNNFLLPNFDSKYRHMLTDFNKIITEGNERIHIHFDYRVFFIPIYLFLLSILKIRGERVVVTMHSYVPPEKANEAFRTYFSNSKLFSLFLKVGAIAMIVRLFNKLNFMLVDKLILHSSCEEPPGNKDLNKVPYPIYSETKKSKNVLFFGRIVKYKGFDLFVETAELCPDVNFIAVFSNIDLKNEKIRNAYQRAKEMENIDLLKSVSNDLLSMLIQYSDCIFLPYRGAYGFSDALAKAISYKKVTVTTDVGTFRKLGFLIKADKDPMDLSEKIKHALNLDEEKRRELKKKMGKYNKENSIESFVSKHEDIYKEIHD